MKHSEVKQQHPSLYLQVCFQNEEPRLPLHTSIALFLLSYCECKSFKVFLVFTKRASSQSLKSQLPEALELSVIQLEDLPQLVRGCRLPAVLDETGRLCRAGLAVVLRHIISKTLEAEPSRKDVLALLGFKKTCLKACAEVSKWTRLCEIGIPSAVEEHLKNPQNQYQQLPLSILTLERRLAEPVKVHNDDKIRRQKLQEQRQNGKNKSPEGQGNPDSESDPGASPQVCDGLELRAALAKLSVDSVPTLATRENSEIRKVKTTDLPPLEHVFAEGLYFTLTDVVLLPCIYQYLLSLQTHAVSTLLQLPHLLRWYRRVQEVPRVLQAAEACGMVLSVPRVPVSSLPGPSAEDNPSSLLEQEEGQEMTTEPPFVGGPRPTMTKLKENGIEAVFARHPCPAWTLPWDSLPGAINPTEGKMSNIRAVRKRQQLNNLVAMVTELARPGYTIVDFCSGTGHVGIALAHTLPDCQIILIENKEESLVRAQSRGAELGLKNIGFIQANLDYFTGPFHIGVALHACGVATDMVMEHCIQAGATFVISPCCYGFIQNAIKFTFPKSKRFQETLTYKEHMILCRFADQTAVQLPPERRLIGKHCMGLVDLDRSWAAEAHGYSVQVMTMEPESCSPKNNMLVGRLQQKSGLEAAASQLEAPAHN
ncbi:glutathione S-transferase C-terminal domain-containing protein [Morone saxatilis]|uniref:glutathione S-transferase C-terminal domain-containing protein n=1 Tax=Morone saxatilis TaxID=34816 RepID=UPI0015E23222|nr:glutathione S-transferase C-terminal domain-containing protein [Morone saxatilis]XP_035516216.1 glutathione S-transferase C-terminal domain-containing protein [Morone saxatilis]XP_035516217.1 glutathione S-transferase C-terminal domain-containing protein [Morone saxatilis]XP_035516218.1 glutathione S-transferase C-terminal domain-containing protein [Morone saxatilis]